MNHKLLYKMCLYVIKEKGQASNHEILGRVRHLIDASRAIPVARSIISTRWQSGRVKTLTFPSTDKLANLGRIRIIQNVTRNLAKQGKIIRIAPGVYRYGS